MADSALDVVRRIYALDTFAAAAQEGLLDPHIEWVNPPEAVEPGTRSGIEAFMGANERVFDSFESYEVKPERFTPVGVDVVVVSADVIATGRSSGLASQLRQFYVWTVREGIAIRFHWTNDEDAAVEIAEQESADG